ncbi:chromosome segregation protein SMC [Fulvivirga sp. 29W222]|uniref:Chromosome segregation protein SMC n=1 Tax=Fulvivirga marina TaxID=2494733 RepID=A0A937FVN3_9BACT|nr:chromosome segregation protein SMC [Fulvivirga marina]MBL6445116.1 chromosome segregation protein SMC [Fulvivirga marina]
MTENTSNNDPIKKEQHREQSIRENKKSNRKTAIIVTILAIIIIVQGIKIYLDHQESVATENQLASTEQELAVTMQRLTDISRELDEKIAEIEKLGGDVTELEKAKADIQDELNRQQRANRSTIRNLKDKVGGYEVLLKAKDEEIEKLKNVNSELLTENTSLKTEKNQLFDSLSEVTKSKEALISKVELASQLKAENILIYAINSRGKEREAPFKSRHADKIKVIFNIAENEVAPIEGKDIMVRIVDGNGQVIFDVAKGSGTFMYEGKEEFYTSNKEILFDNTRQQLTFEYEKGSEWEEGLYNLEVYTEGYKMGSKQFEVK